MFFSALLTSVFYISNPFGVKGKVLGIDTRKILRPDPGHRTHYYPSYDIFSVSQILKKYTLKKSSIQSCRFWHSEKVFLTVAILLGVKGKNLGIDKRKILRPDPGHRTHYYPSYVIFCGSNMFKSHAKTGLKLGRLKICVPQKIS